MVMVVENVCHMNRGDGENSYSRNSSLQKKVILKVRPTLEDAIKTHYSTLQLSFPPQCFHIADLGCSSGNNTFLAVSGVIDTVVGLCRRQRVQPIPEFHVALNDLPENDFNFIISESLSKFYDEMRRKGVGSCFVSCVPGSFYTRLFPTKTLHFVHSSYSLQWLSRVPDGIDNNKGNIFIGIKSSPPNVFEAYLRRFQDDFSTFLSCRAEEIVDGGQMILTFVGRSTPCPARKGIFLLWEILSESLLDMAKEGIIKEMDIDSFNVPVYMSSSGEVRDIIEKEGSFNLDKLETFETSWDPYDDDDDDGFPADKYRSSQRVAQTIRAVCEPMVERHFGSGVVNELFTRFSNRVAEVPDVERKYFNLVVLLTKKN